MGKQDGVSCGTEIVTFPKHHVAGKLHKNRISYFNSRLLWLSFWLLEKRVEREVKCGQLKFCLKWFSWVGLGWVGSGRCGGNKKTVGKPNTAPLQEFAQKAPERIEKPISTGNKRARCGQKKITENGMTGGNRREIRKSPRYSRGKTRRRRPEDVEVRKHTVSLQKQIADRDKKLRKTWRELAPDASPESRGKSRGTSENVTKTCSCWYKSMRSQSKRHRGKFAIAKLWLRVALDVGALFQTMWK